MLGLVPGLAGVDFLKLWGSIKWALLAVVLVASHLFVYFEGRESCMEGANKALEKEVARVEKQAKEGIKQAEKDANRLSDTRRKLDDLAEEATKLSTPDTCVLNDDQLRHLDSIQNETTTK